MALDLKFCYSSGSDCKSFLIKDETGAYDAVTNIGGYGDPNLEIADVDLTEIIVTKPDDSKVTFNPAIFPTTNMELIYVINAASLGYTSVIEDGLYTIKYKLTDINNVVYKTSKTFLFTCSLACKIQNILADSVKFQMNCDDCNSGINENLEKAMMIQTLYDGLCAMSQCGTSSTKINEALDNLQTMVSEYDLENCNC